VKVRAALLAQHAGSVPYADLGNPEASELEAAKYLGRNRGVIAAQLRMDRLECLKPKQLEAAVDVPGPKAHDSAAQEVPSATHEPPLEPVGPYDPMTNSGISAVIFGCD
jgi:hypothetical protein